jgi:hypothetical protein
VVKSSLDPCEKPDHAIQFRYLFRHQATRLPRKSVPLDESENRADIIDSRTQSQSLLLGQVRVIRHTDGEDPTFLATGYCSLPPRILRSLPKILESGSKDGAIGDPKLGSDSVHRATGLLTGLSDSLFRSVACVLDLLPGIDHSPDGDHETQDTHGQADDTCDVSKRSGVTEDDRQRDNPGEDARSDYPCFPREKPFGHR